MLYKLYAILQCNTHKTPYKKKKKKYMFLLNYLLFPSPLLKKKIIIKNIYISSPPLYLLQHQFNKLLSFQIPSSSITSVSRKYVLTAVWEKLRQDPENLSPGLLSIWIHDKLYAFIPAINNEILNCITTTTVTCDGLEAM